MFFPANRFGDVLPSQSLGLALKKLNLTHNGKQHKDKMAKTYRKPNLNPKPIVNCQNCSYVCAHHYAQCSTRHNTEQFWQSSLLSSRHSSLLRCRLLQGRAQQSI